MVSKYIVKAPLEAYTRQLIEKNREFEILYR